MEAAIALRIPFRNIFDRSKIIMSLSTLNNIISSTPYFSSHELLVHWLSKCELLIRDVESIIDSDDASELLSSSIRREDFVFLARGPQFKTLIKKIGKTLNEYKASEELELRSLYKKMISIISPFSKLPIKTRELILQNSGHDVLSSLTSPYPLFISPLINQGTNCLAETEEVRRLFSEDQTSILYTKYIITNFSTSEIASLRIALIELNSISPYILYDVTMNVRFFAKIIPEIPDPSSVHMSLTMSYLPGICFFSDGVFRRRESISECILHEALHMKYLQTIEIYYIHSASYTGDTGRSFYCPWRKNDNIWIFSRAFAAFHVYAHLYIYYTAMLDKGLPDGYCQDWVEERKKTCYDRSYILQEYVDCEKDQAFSFDGFKFYTSLLDAIRAS